MIQRIQTIYLLIATLLAWGLPWFLSLWTTADEALFYAYEGFNKSNGFLIVIPVLFLLSGLITSIAIFKFNNRQLQFVLGRISILINFLLLGIFVYFSQNLSGEMQVSEKGIGLLIPIVIIVLIALANRAIKKDEALVKSVDRLR